MRISIEADIRLPRPRRSRIVLATTIAVALLVPAGAFANHQFSDVPSDHTFHNPISRIADAAITTGCGANTFCPDNPVTRGQMAAFLTRGLARGARTNLLGTATSSTPVTLGTIQITAGDVQGGYAYVLLSATVNAYAIQAGCYCEATTLILRGMTVVSQEVYMDLPAVNTPTDGDTDEVATTTNMIVVPTGVPQTFSVRFQRTVGSATVYAFGTLWAVVIPFDGLGNAPMGFAAEEAIVGK